MTSKARIVSGGELKSIQVMAMQKVLDFNLNTEVLCNFTIDYLSLKSTFALLLMLSNARDINFYNSLFSVSFSLDTLYT